MMAKLWNYEVTEGSSTSGNAMEARINAYSRPVIITSKTLEGVRYYDLDISENLYDSWMITGMALNLAHLIETTDLAVVDTETVLHSSANLITLDADLSHDPKEIPKMINILKKRPFVIGSRYMTGGKCNMSLPRLLLSIMGNKFIKFLLNISCHEFTTSYRGFNLRKLKNFNLTSVKAKGYSFFMETIYILNKRKFSIYEIPINFENRTHGKSKIPTLEIFRTLIRVFILSLRT